MKKQKEELKYGRKGITLISLVVTIIVLIILASVSINLLFGENGLITMAQKAKDQYEEAAKNEEQQLAGVFGKNFVDYNGQLHVNGSNIMNQYDENIVLRGISAGNSVNLTEEYYNQDSLTAIKSWGANVFRVPVDVLTTDIRIGYVDNPEIINRAYEIMDICINLDMYVIIDWHVLSDKNPNNYISEAKDFFTKIATRYKDVPNVIYEICNEPNGDDVTWEVIKNYANEIIPIIRNISNEAIIIVGTPNYSHTFDEVIGNELEYENIMYTCHWYPQYMSDARMKSYMNAVENNLPIFVTEWGTSTSEKEEIFLSDVSKKWLNYMAEHNISWCNWALGEGVGYGIVERGKWDNSLNDNILTETGKFIKATLQNNIAFDEFNNLSELMPYTEDYAFWKEDIRNNITKIIIENSIDHNKINNAIESWDVTSEKSKKNVIAYIENDSENVGKYILYIAGEGDVYCTFSCRYLFADFKSVKEIDLTHLNTTGVTDMAYMFNGDVVLEKITLGNFDTSSVMYMSMMFRNCQSLKDLDTKQFKVSTVAEVQAMFDVCISLTSIDLSGFDFARVYTTKQMFERCDSLQSLDLSNADFTNVTEYSDMFAYFYNSDCIIIVRDQKAKEFVETRLVEAGYSANVVIKNN